MRELTLVRLAALMRERRFELLALLSLEIGKDWYEADAEIAEAIDFCEVLRAPCLTHFEYKPLARLVHEDNCYSYIPLGVGAVIRRGTSRSRFSLHDHCGSGEREHGGAEAFV